MDITELADACQSLAENLDGERAKLNYEGPQAIKLGELSSNLISQASTLRTLAVAQAITGSTGAMTALTNGTDAAKKAAGKLKDAATAIQIAGLILSLGAAVISENPGAVISVGSGLVTALNNLRLMDNY